MRGCSRPAVDTTHSAGIPACLGETHTTDYLTLFLITLSLSLTGHPTDPPFFFLSSLFLSIPLFPPLNLSTCISLSFSPYPSLSPLLILRFSFSPYLFFSQFLFFSLLPSPFSFIPPTHSSPHIILIIHLFSRCLIT